MTSRHVGSRNQASDLFKYNGKIFCGRRDKLFSGQMSPIYGRLSLEWNAFYAAMAGSSATVVGLIFVAAQLRYQKFSRKPLWDAIASSTFFMYFLVFFLSLTFLIPGLEALAKSVIILAHIGLGVYRVVRIWSPVWIGIFKNGEQGIADSLWFLVGPFVLYSLLGYQAIKIFVGRQEPSLDTQIAFILLVVLGLALRNSWTLLMDRDFQENHSDPRY